MMPIRDRRRGARTHSQAWQHLYNTKRWRRLRAWQLNRHPYCQCPSHKGRKLRADDPEHGGAVVDHIKPHEGDTRLFFSRSNLQTMTKHCHDGAKQVKEKSGYWPGCDVDGNPLDPDDDWWD